VERRAAGLLHSDHVIRGVANDRCVVAQGQELVDDVYVGLDADDGAAQTRSVRRRGQRRPVECGSGKLSTSPRRGPEKSSVRARKASSVPRANAHRGWTNRDECRQGRGMERRA
jgi:hypothetical protein